tara:strand:+ start:507 stop:1328 length:822 start_codon:yes stop_codon:yes gene_type:complete
MEKNLNYLINKANILRKHVIEMVARQGKGYVQQGLGASDLFSVLFFNELKNINILSNINRDRFFLSTAHNSALFHATMAEKGLINIDSLKDYCVDGSPLEINVSERLGPFVEATCGSLGQGLSVAIGMALSAKRRKLNSRFYVILGDGELQEGQTWEAILSASSWKVDNLCLVVDYNNMQVEGSVEQVMSLEPLIDKFLSFGWNTINCNGNKITELLDSFNEARNCSNKPSVIIAKTLVGKGVDFLEGQLSHNLTFPQEIAKKALISLENYYE